MKKRLLIITRHRLNENNGGANGSKGFVRCFAELFDDCSLIFPDFGEDTAPYIPSKYKLYPCHDSRSNIRKGLDCYRGVLSPLASFAEKHLATHQYDVIVIDHSFIAGALPKAVKRRTEAKLITIHHNVERDYLRDNRQQFALSFRLPYIHFAKQAERQCLLASDVNMTVTPQDADTFRSWYPDNDLHLHDWGDYEWQPLPEKAFSPKSSGHTFVITGSLYFEQSLQPIMAFVGRYWPLVRQAAPDSRLIIAGRNPAKPLFEACRQQPEISIVPNPADMAQIVASADYYVCPIDKGSGRKLRVMDGLKQGLPVLCHALSAAGYERMVTCGCLFPYHDEDTFLASLHRMMAAQAAPAAVYQAYCQNYSAEAGTERLRQILAHEGML